jgi:hypothetical protein
VVTPCHADPRWYSSLEIWGLRRLPSTERPPCHEAGSVWLGGSIVFIFYGHGGRGGGSPVSFIPEFSSF